MNLFPAFLRPPAAPATCLASLSCGRCRFSPMTLRPVSRIGPDCRRRPGLMIPKRPRHGGIVRARLSSRRATARARGGQPRLLQLDEAAIACGRPLTSITDSHRPVSGPDRVRARGPRAAGGRLILRERDPHRVFPRIFASHQPEALARVEVLSRRSRPAVAFRPIARVINPSSRTNNSNRERFGIEAPLAPAAFPGNEQDFGYLENCRGGRFNLDFELTDTSLLTEDERNIRQTPVRFSQVAGRPRSGRVPQPARRYLQFRRQSFLAQVSLVESGHFAEGANLNLCP